MTRRVARWVRLGLSPLALKELLAVSRPDDLMAVAVGALGLAALLGTAWVVPHPVLLQVRHAPVAIACGLTLVQLLSSVHRARLVLDERAGGTYETLILSGASGARFVAGMVQASLLRAVQPLALMLPVFAACAAALGTPLATVAGFYALLGAQLVLASALGVLGASEPAGTRAGRTPGSEVRAFRMGAAAYVLPTVAACLMLPTLWFAIRGLPREALAAALGDAPLLPLVFCAPAVFALDSLRIGGVEVPFLALAVAVNLGLAAIPFARAAARHRHHRHDLTRARRGLTVGAYLLAFGLTVASLGDGAGFGALALVACVHLMLMLAIAPDATAPAWPASGAGEVPGITGAAFVLRERAGTGPAFLALLAGIAAPFYARVAPAGGGGLAMLAWLYVSVVSLAWAMVAFELPAPEPVPRTGLGLRTALLMLGGVSLTAILWDETLVEAQAPWLVLPARVVLGLAVISTPLSGLLGLTAMTVALPVLRRGSLAGAAVLCRTSPGGLFMLSLGWHAAVAVVGWVRAILLARRAAARPC